MSQVLIPYKPHAGQVALHNSKARFRVAPCGRRFGKTLGGSADVLWKMLKKVGDYGWIAPTANHTNRGLDEMRNLTNNEYFSIVESYPKQLVCANGSKLYYLSADKPDAVRGYGFKHIVCDEFQKITTKAWQYAIEPTISQTRGSALLIGTPFGRGQFHQLHTRGLDENYPEYESSNFRSVDNPYFPIEEWERVQRELPSDAFRQEYMAEFLDDSAGVFRGVSECVSDLPVNTSRDYIIGVDLAKHVDFTVLICLCKKTGRVVEMQRFNKIDWGFQKQRIIDFYNKYRGDCVVDSTGVGDPVSDDLHRAGVRVIPFKFTNQSKKDIVQSLAVAIELGQISWASKYSDITSELQRYEYKISESTKNISYNAPSGYHDDTVMALALAVHHWKKDRPLMFASV